VADGILHDKPEPITYAPGSWGPSEADDLVAPRRWFLSQ
jgi:hypothetical protein